MLSDLGAIGTLGVVALMLLLFVRRLLFGRRPRIIVETPRSGG